MRQANFEILRVVAMLMIVFWHFIQNVMMKKTAIGEPASLSILNYAILQYGMILCSIGVNLYVMITGYFLVDKPFKSNRFIRVWVQTVFYSAAIALLFYFMLPEKYTIKDLLIGFIPIHSCSYWFVTDYLGLILIAPFLGKAARLMTHSQYIKLLFVIFLVGTNFIGGYPFGDVMGFNLGYSLIWFICLFLIGAYIRLHEDKIPQNNYFKLYLIVGVIIFIWFVIRHFIKAGFSFDGLSYNDLHYNSFPVILAFFLFVWFKRHRFKTNHITAIIVKIAPYTFGVYLIHNNRYLSHWIWNQIFRIDSTYSVPLALFATFLIFIICIIVDYCRKFIFKLTYLDFIISKISAYIDTLISNLSLKVFRI